MQDVEACLRKGGLWCRERLLPRLLGLLIEAWQLITGRCVRRWATTLLLVAGALAGARILPVAYARLALAHAARIAARQSRIHGEEHVIHDLRRRAFNLGLPEAALEPEIFKLQANVSDAGPLCTITYEFTHVVNFYGLFRVPVKIRGKATQLQMEPQSTPGNDESEPETSGNL